MKGSITLLPIIALVGVALLWYFWPLSGRFERLTALEVDQEYWDKQSGGAPWVVMSLPTAALRDPQHLRRYQYWEEAIRELPGVQRVITILDRPGASTDQAGRFLTVPDDSVQLDSLLRAFYRTSPHGEWLTNAPQTATFMVVIFQKDITKAQQQQLLDDIRMLSDQFSQATGISLRYGATNELHEIAH